MIRFLRRFRQPLIVSLVLVFLIGIFVGLGGYFFTGYDTTEAAAVVEGHKIPYLHFRTRLDQYLESLRAQNQEVTAEMSARVRDEMLRDMIVSELLAQQAERMGMRVSDSELALAIRQTPGFQRDGQFDENLYYQAVRYRFKTSPEQFERLRRREMLSARLRTLMFRNSKLAPGELRGEYLRAKAPLAEFEQRSAEFEADLRQRRALDTINFFLRQRAATADIRNFLDQRERGL